MSKDFFTRNMSLLLKCKKKRPYLKKSRGFFFLSEIEENEESKDNRAIRTWLSAGSIHMNGTTTIAVARELENNSKFLIKGKNGYTNV